ncbi:MAG: hypothetical protein LBR45_03785 [Bacteroidales bacterium]|jgi:hypothetical protein|nr:hypothetical protein [Bacteroidales bacterium]
MKTVIAVIFTFLLTAYEQTASEKTLLDRAKELFESASSLSQKEFDKFDYYQIVSMLEKFIELNPTDAEARYFLGYTYSRINSRDGRSMLNMDLNLLYKSSEQFEKVIELEPKYTGEIVILDPYSKLSAEWGSMAMSYWHNNKADSAVWAFKEGKKRGGFSDFILELNREALDECSKNAILISSGDNFSIPLWYLQIVEKYRTDVAVVDINLLGTTWYPAFLSYNKVVAFDLPGKILDTLEYTEWSDSIITIDHFSWTVKPSYDKYLLRSDRVFLSLLKENKFRRDLYFTIFFAEDKRLNLKEYLSPRIVTDKLSISDKTSLSFEDYKKRISHLLSLSKRLNLNSVDEHMIFDYSVRYSLLKTIQNYLLENEKGKAKELMNLLDKFASEQKVPFYNESGKKAYDFLKQEIQK